MKKIILFLICFTPLLSYAQSCENARSLFVEKGKEFAYQVMKKISPNTGKNLYLSVDSFTPNPVYSKKVNKCLQSVFINWTSNRCVLCSEELQCRVSGYVMYNYATKAWEFELEDVNDEVKEVQDWNRSISLGSVLAITGAVIYGASSLANSSKSSASSSGSSNSSSSSSGYSGSSSYSSSKSTCSECNGRGICTQCAGKGQYYCNVCKGTGKEGIFSQRCYSCEGKGIKFCKRCSGKGVCWLCGGKGAY